MAFLFAMLMWGVVYQGYNAVFPAFFQELFPTKTRVTGFAIVAEPRHADHRLPAGDLRRARRPDARARCVVDKKFAARRGAPTGETCRALADSIEMDVVWTVGSITLAIAIIAAIAGFSARETFRMHMNDLGNKNAVPVPQGGVRPHPDHRGGRAGALTTLSLLYAAGPTRRPGRAALPGATVGGRECGDVQRGISGGVPLVDAVQPGRRSTTPDQRRYATCASVSLIAS